MRLKQRSHSPFGHLHIPHTGSIKESAELIAPCCSGIFTAENPNVPSSTLTSNFVISVKFTPAMLRRHLKNKRNYASPDFDGVTYLLLKRGRFFLLHQLSSFLQFYFNSCVTPEHWKIVSVVPLKVIAHQLSTTV